MTPEKVEQMRTVATAVADGQFPATDESKALAKAFLAHTEEHQAIVEWAVTWRSGELVDTMPRDTEADAREFLQDIRPLGAADDELAVVRRIVMRGPWVSAPEVQR